MKEKPEPIEVELGEGVDEGRRGFLKIFGAAAVGTAVAGKGVAEAAKLLAAKPKAEEGFSGVLDKDTKVKAHPGEEVAVRPKEEFVTPEDAELDAKRIEESRVHPWNLVIEYRDWDNTDREIVVPFVGSNIDVEVPESIKYIKAIYVVATERTPRGADSPTITLRRGYSGHETARRAGVRHPWQGEIERTAKVRTLTEDDLARMNEKPEELPEVPDLSYYEKVKEERLAKNLRKNFVGRGGMIREDGTIVEFSDEEDL
jgi:hypothetical protein